MISKATAALLLLGLAVLSSCTPKPPIRANAVLGQGMTVFGRSAYDECDAVGDTRLTARYRSGDIYARRRHGHWITSWQLVRFDVLRVDRGVWPDPDLTFTCASDWPTPESGIVICQPPWPYRPGAVWGFELDTTQQPAQIVSQHAPPGIAPHKSLR